MGLTSRKWTLWRKTGFPTFRGGMSSRARLIVPVLVFLLICLLEDSQCGAARQRARHRRLFRGESELGQAWGLWTPTGLKPGLAFSSVADNRRLLERHVQTSKICLLLLLNLLKSTTDLLQICVYDRVECRSRCLFLRVWVLIQRRRKSTTMT